jgi:hypothetical protein
LSTIVSSSMMVRARAVAAAPGRFVCADLRIEFGPPLEILDQLLGEKIRDRLAVFVAQHEGRGAERECVCPAALSTADRRLGRQIHRDSASSGNRVRSGRWNAAAMRRRHPGNGYLIPLSTAEISVAAMPVRPDTSVKDHLRLKRSSRSFDTPFDFTMLGL